MKRLKKQQQQKQNKNDVTLYAAVSGPPSARLQHGRLQQQPSERMQHSVSIVHSQELELAVMQPLVLETQERVCRPLIDVSERVRPTIVLPFCTIDSAFFPHPPTPFLLLLLLLLTFVCGIVVFICVCSITCLLIHI